MSSCGFRIGYPVRFGEFRFRESGEPFGRSQGFLLPSFLFWLNKKNPLAARNPAKDSRSFDSFGRDRMELLHSLLSRKPIEWSESTACQVIGSFLRQFPQKHRSEASGCGRICTFGLGAVLKP